MPTYEYKCTACGTHFERRQSMSDEPVKTCPECAGAVRRVLFPVGIVFKGSGFYVTDNGRSGKNGGSGASSTNSSEKTEGTPAKAESAAAEPKVTADKAPAATKAAEAK